MVDGDGHGIGWVAERMVFEEAKMVTVFSGVFSFGGSRNMEQE